MATCCHDHWKMSYRVRPRTIPENCYVSLIFTQYWLQTIHCALFTVNRLTWTILSNLFHTPKHACYCLPHFYFILSLDTDTIVGFYLFRVLNKSLAAMPQ